MKKIESNRKNNNNAMSFIYVAGRCVGVAKTKCKC